ncbi:FRG domain-containing protein [Breznakiellaceae bacterium SP9]
MEITSVNEYLQRCFSHKDRQNKGNKEQVLFFRGEHDKYKKLLPSIYQPGYDIDHENQIFKETVAAFPEEMLSKKTTIERLIFMRHYELPTRLLDISKNPLVGLFFACYREHKIEREKDSLVYVFSVPQKEIKFYDSDSVCLVANICKRPADFSIKGIDNLNRDDFNKEEVIQCLVYEARSDKPEFQNFAEPATIKSVICLHPVMNNPRIINQAGYFFLFGVKGDKKDCVEIKDDWITDKILIPGNAKKRILEELDLLNINESVLYTDYKHLANTLRERYRKK